MGCSRGSYLEQPDRASAPLGASGDEVTAGSPTTSLCIRHCGLHPASAMPGPSRKNKKSPFPSLVSLLASLPRLFTPCRTVAAVGVNPRPPFRNSVHLCAVPIPHFFENSAISPSYEPPALAPFSLSPEWCVRLWVPRQIQRQLATVGSISRPLGVEREQGQKQPKHAPRSTKNERRHG